MSDPIEVVDCTFTNEAEDLRAEITRLRALVETAYREGLQTCLCYNVRYQTWDGAVLASWEQSEARKALGDN